ncbi:TPA: phosphatase PAP2 family protein [Candidatus Poribacteria bacterium]|nr:phosphatase PAP2 family protein [Candidatus Poribacteria bacterium]
MNKNHLTIQIVYILLIIAVISPAFAKDESNLFIRADRRIFEFIHDETPRIRFLSDAMEGITELGDSQTVLGLTLLLVAFGNEYQFETGKLVTVAFGGTSIVILALKQMVRRARPLEKKAAGLNSSFPSGHAGTALAVATVLSNQYPRLKIPLYLGATLVCLSRIYLGRHYPADVIAGAVVGMFTATEVMRHKEFFLQFEVSRIFAQ